MAHACTAQHSSFLSAASLSLHTTAHHLSLSLRMRTLTIHTSPLPLLSSPLSSNTKQVGRDLSHIGNSLCDLGRYEDAYQAFRDAQAIDTAALGPEHLHTATDGASVGLVLATMRKYNEALPHLDAAHRLLSASLEPSHPNLVAVSRFLSECHERMAAEGA